MQADRAEVAMAAAQPGLDDEIEADLVKRLPSETVVEGAQRDRGLIGLPPEGSVEQALVNGGDKTAPLRPRSHGAVFFCPISAASERVRCSRWTA